jgi:hypothetical protein
VPSPHRAAKPHHPQHPQHPAPSHPTAPVPNEAERPRQHVAQARPLEERRDPLRAVLAVAVISVVISAGATAIFKARFR